MRINPTKIVHSVRDFVLAQPSPVLVHQMSKVGSTTVCKTLRAAGIRPWHVHFISPKQWQAVRDAYYQSGQYDLPRHMYLEFLARNYLKLTNHRVKVISLVRDPVAREVSGIFQVPEFAGINVSESSIDNLASQIADHVCNNSKNSRYERKWFDEEIKEVYDIDIFQYPFNKEEGYGIYNSRRADIIILQLERLGENINGILSSFIGSELEMVKGNIRTSKKEGRIYYNVINRVNICKNTCNHIYNSDWMKYFYKEEDISGFKKRWS